MLTEASVIKTNRLPAGERGWRTVRLINPMVSRKDSEQRVIKRLLGFTVIPPPYVDSNSRRRIHKQPCYLTPHTALMRFGCVTQYCITNSKHGLTGVYICADISAPLHCKILQYDVCNLKQLFYVLLYSTTLSVCPVLITETANEVVVIDLL